MRNIHYTGGGMCNSPKMLNFLCIMHFSTTKHVLTLFFHPESLSMITRTFLTITNHVPPPSTAQESYNPSKFPVSWLCVITSRLKCLNYDGIWTIFSGKKHPNIVLKCSSTS